jgi:hypothetical protein
VKTVTLAMYAKGTIVTVCGAPASGGSGTAGDNAVDGILAIQSYLGNPTAVKAGPDDSIYISSSAYKKVKRIDRYGYLYDFAGTGVHGTIAGRARRFRADRCRLRHRHRPGREPLPVQRL